MADKTGKKYGLILKKKSTSVQLKPSIFGGDDSGDEETGRKTVNVTIRKEAEKNKQMRQTQLEINKVLEEDPSAYDYDAVYDKMAERKANLLAAKAATANRKPKYISNLLKFAEVRKKEDERRTERQVQKERETEGTEFADKDAFVTSAYRQRMQEMAEEEERQRKLDERDGDVTKQADLSKFYRNLLDRNVSAGGSFDTEKNTASNEDKANQSRQSPSPGKERNETKTGSLEDEMKLRENPDGKSEGNSHRKNRNAEYEGKSNTKKESIPEQNRARTGGDRSREKSKEHEKRERGYDERKSKHEQEKHEKEQHEQEENAKPENEEISKKHEKRDERAQEENAKSGNEESKKHKTESSRKRSYDESGSKTDKDLENSENMDKKDECLDRTSDKKKHVVNKYAKHASNETVMSARERYLARKKTRVVEVQVGSDDED